MHEFYMILARKIIKIPEFFYDICPQNLQNSRILHDFCPKNARIYIIDRKIFFLNFRGHVPPPLPSRLLRLWIKKWFETMMHETLSYNGSNH